MKYKRSFTLLELIIVVFIVGILSVLILPGLGNKYQIVEFDNYSYKVLRVFKFSQDEALKAAKSQNIKILKDSFVMYLNSSEIARLNVPSKYRIDTDITEVFISPLGGFRVFSDMRLLERGEIKVIFKTKVKKIILWPGSGDVSIEE